MSNKEKAEENPASSNHVRLVAALWVEIEALQGAMGVAKSTSERLSTVVADLLPLS